MSMPFALYGVLFSLSALVVRAEYEFPATAPTLYYDNLWDVNGNVCGEMPSYGLDWNIRALSTPMCEYDFQPATIMSEYKTNQIVAIDNRMLKTAEGRSQYCGKKIRVYKPDGTEYISAGGDMYIWDGCQACADSNGGKVDFSAPDWLAMNGHGKDECGIGPASFRVVITDENVIEPTGHPPDAPNGKNTFVVQPGGAVGSGGPGDGSAVADTSGASSQVDPAVGNGVAGAAPAPSGQSTSAVATSSDAGQWQSTSAAPPAQGTQPSSQHEQGQHAQLPGHASTDGQWNGDQAGVGSAGPGTGGQQQGGAVNFAAGDTAAGSATASTTSGIQSSAEGVADISAGNCVEGKYRCSDPTIQVCGRNNQGQIGWVDHTPCPRGCQELQLASPSCI